MKIKFKRKPEQKVYTFCTDGLDFVVTDGNYTFKSHNLTIVRSFAERLKDSGHKVECTDDIVRQITCDEIYDDGCTSCAGCVLNTGNCCLIHREECD